MKRRLFTVFLTLSILTVYLPVNAVFAVRLAPGSVPQTRPLQPIPEGTAPNLSENIESHNQDDLEAVEPEGENSQGGKTGIPDFASTSPAALGGNQQAIAALTILTLAAIGLAVWFYLRARKKESQ